MCSDGSGDVLAELEAAVDALAAQDLKPMFGPQILELTTRLLRVQNKLAAQVARTVREGELSQAPEHDGKKTMQSWLRGHALLSPRAAGQAVRNGRALEQLPALAAACAAGAVTDDAVAVIGQITKPEHLAAAEGQGIDLAEIDRLLTQVAVSQPHHELGQVVHHYLAGLDPDGREPDPTEGRSLTIVKHADGSVSGRFDLDAVGGERVQLALESVVQASRPKGDERTRSQQLGDAFVQLADNALAAGDLPILRGAKPQVAVVVKLEDLVDPDDASPGVATTGLGARISAARARWLACDGAISRVVMAPDGRVVDHGRDKRLIPHALRRTLEVRDTSCVFAGCEAPAWWCDVHHLIHWADGGETSEENSALLCERHHTKVHHGFTVVRDPDGRWHTYRPDGTEILIGYPLLV